MDKIEKALRTLSVKERQRVKEILEQLGSGGAKNLDIKKLKGREDIFRVRKGTLRILYRLDDKKRIFLLAIERRKEDTYT